MKIKLQTKINFNLNKVNKESTNDLIFNNVIRKVLRAATAKIMRAFRKNVDVRGNKYESLSTKYKKYKSEVAPGKPIMVGQTGKLKSSIKSFTNQKDVTGFIGSNTKNQEYFDHLTGDDSRFLPQRKWFFTKDEEDDMFETEDMLKKEFDVAIDDFSKKFVSQLVGSFRNLGEEIKIK